MKKFFEKKIRLSHNLSLTIRNYHKTRMLQNKNIFEKLFDTEAQNTNKKKENLDRESFGNKIRQILKDKIEETSKINEMGKNKPKAENNEGLEKKIM
jgi:hypothetical protein